VQLWVFGLDPVDDIQTRTGCQSF